MSDEPTWEAPGPGAWVVDLHHTGPTPSRPVRDLFPAACRQGMAEGFELLGAPLRTIDMAFVNGRYYRRLVPAVGGDRDLPDPPAPLLWLAARLHPTLRRRERIARRTLAERRWRDELAQWESDWKPTIEAANTRFGAVDPAGLCDADLAGHLEALWSHLERTTTLHFRLHATDAGPIGLLLAATDAWGLDRARVLATLGGSSPASSEPAVQLAAVRLAVHATFGDRRPSRAELDDVPEVAAYLGRFGWRLATGYDLTDRTLAELPDVILATCTAAPDAPLADPTTMQRASEEAQRIVDELRAEVPAADRPAFDLALADAQEAYGLRDENGPLTYEWPAGLLRRGLLDAGRRLGARGALAGCDHVFDATVAEVATLLRGSAAPSAEDLAGRHAERMSWRHATPPPTLGREESMPPGWTLPPAMRRLTEATIAVVELLDAQAPEPAAPSRTTDAGTTDAGTTDAGTSAGGLVGGIGIGHHVHRGTARVVTDALDALDRVAPGDVLVTTMTVPTFNAVLAVAGAVVVAEGGLLSHAAVMARELGIPAVIGAVGAVEVIPDGAEVEVDPVAGVVRRC